MSAHRRRRSHVQRSTLSIRILGGLAILSGVLAVFAAVIAVWLHAGSPQSAGTVSLKGLGAAVTVSRDRDGVPLIEAQSSLDAYRTLGFVHAQDRLFQMDLQRHYGSGRLAEWFGSGALDSDRMMRTLDLRGHAERSLAKLSPELQQVLVAYADGVNAYISSHRYVWPPEYYLLLARPEPWVPADSLVWGRIMGLTLSGNWRSEIRRARLAARLPPALYDGLFNPADRTTLTSLAEAAPDLDRLLRRAGLAMPESLMQRSASNAWAISGTRTETGKPILANDPHLGFSAPGLWYLARIETPQMHVTGATVAGVPFVILGRNRDIAWGMTTTGADTQDLFVERLSAGRTDFYEAPEGPQQFKIRKETILVRHGDPDYLTVRESHHGPILSDLKATTSDIATEGQVVALSATALADDDTTPEAFFRLQTATDWDSFRNALSYFGAPVQNVMYADRAGHIGLIAAGTIPIRKTGDGLLPVAGWDGAHDWIGVVAPKRWPQRLDPPSGRLVNANNRIVGDDYPFLIAREWDSDFRARRISDVLVGQPAHTISDSASLQLDTHSVGADTLLPRLLKVKGGSPFAIAARDKLAAWDHRMAADQPEPLIYAGWLRVLQRMILKPVHDALESEAGWTPSVSVLARMLAEDGPWCGGQPGGDATCDAVILRAQETSLAELRETYGTDMSAWRWGNAHRARFDHPLFSRLPILKNIVGLSVSVSGGDDTVGRAAYRSLGPGMSFDDIHGAGYRAVYDMAQPMAARMIASPGQSGLPMSRHFEDFVGRWVRGGLNSYPAATDGDSAGTSVLMLMP